LLRFARNDDFGFAPAACKIASRRLRGSQCHLQRENRMMIRDDFPLATWPAVCMARTRDLERMFGRTGLLEPRFPGTGALFFCA
jgi:hypothetical protein